MTPATAPDDAEAALVHEVTAAITADGTLSPGTFSVVVSHRRQRHALTTLRDGQRVVRILPTSTAPVIVQFIRENAARLESDAQRMAERSPQHPAKHLADGCELSWLGERIQLHLVDTPIPVQLRRGENGTGFLIAHRGDIARNGARPIIEWYSRAGLAWLEAAAPASWSRLRCRRPLPALAVRDFGRRYGGDYRARTHEVALHWAAFQLPPSLLEYVLVHELVHATRPRGQSHGSEFRTRLQRVMPDARAQQDAFRAAFRYLWLGTEMGIA
ncbi:hypothetical protein C9F11_43115 (plasmid) [Streptomyces sp. YIM 121038]|uniref:YgjP-like metallopeptidase domain-containing protein n=1 Tax=Streptomyces sp. YIM 121038 TaxID=2136401 RepID=UPI0011631F8C|nr:YgjP-like metallopeptidase domain-containing protein [Streptomyces sp. YIM 121038]QCX82203.1 hypothetical protein C9F11_43115 [Streptomyces sp. YIM 121038]